MAHSELGSEACCGGHGRGGHGGAREPFAFPGTTRKYSRDRVVDVRHIRLDVTVDPEHRSIEGTASHTVAALNDGCERVVFDAVEMTVTGVTDAAGRALA